MVGKKPVDKATKGLNALVDEFTAAVKELVNAGEETVVHMAVGSSRVISAVVDTPAKWLTEHLGGSCRRALRVTAGCPLSA